MVVRDLPSLPVEVAEVSSLEPEVFLDYVDLTRRHAGLKCGILVISGFLQYQMICSLDRWRSCELLWPL